MKALMIVVFAVAAGVVLSAVSAAVLTNQMGPSSPASSSSSTTTSGSFSGLCVTVGEPVYPYPTTLSLQAFVKNMQSSYFVNVNETAGLVTVTDPNGGPIGPMNSSSFSVRIIAC
jgi:hypothetical protein